MTMNRHVKTRVLHKARRLLAAALIQAGPAPAVYFGLTSLGPSADPPVMAGYLNSDTNPETGSVTAWGGVGNVAVDYQRRSVALDFGKPTSIRSVKIMDSNSSARTDGEDYSLWYSLDNSTYTRIAHWQFCAETIDGRLVHTFTGFDVTARYLKINTLRTDGAYTFVLQGLQDSIWSFRNAIPDFGITLHSDGDRLFPPGELNFGVPAGEAVSTILQEIDFIAEAGFRTLKMGMGTDVLNWNTSAGSPRDWRLDDPEWALPAAVWEQYADSRGRAWTARNLFAAGIDPVRVAAERAKERGMYFFLSCRIADTHFTADPENYPLTSKFYLERERSADPEVRIAIKHSGSSPVPGYSRFDQLMNFDKVSVRNYRLNIIAEALERYGDVIDGFEIEFNRSPALFPLGQGSSKTGLTTGFLQSVREQIDGLQNTSSPLYFGIRVPWDQTLCLSQGLDVDQQIRDRRVDYVVPSNIMTVSHDMDIRGWIAAGRPNRATDRGVAVYAGLPARKPSGWSFPREYTNPSNYTVAVGAENPQLLGAALGFYAMGADGIELYNFAGLVASVSGRTRLSGLAAHLARDSETGSLDKIFAVTPVHSKPYEGRMEYAKCLPAEFRTNGTVWANSQDGVLIQQGNNRHTSLLFITGRETMQGEEKWFLRLGIRPLPNQNPDFSGLDLRITVNSLLLRDGPVSGNPSVDLIEAGSETSPAPSHYIIIPIGNAFPLKEAGFNTITIQQNSSSGVLYGFSLQEIQTGVFP